MAYVAYALWHLSSLVAAPPVDIDGIREPVAHASGYLRHIRWFRLRLLRSVAVPVRILQQRFDVSQIGDAASQTDEQVVLQSTR